MPNALMTFTKEEDLPGPFCWWRKDEYRYLDNGTVTETFWRLWWDDETKRYGPFQVHTSPIKPLTWNPRDDDEYESIRRHYGGRGYQEI